jgi:hypothetical protein
MSAGNRCPSRVASLSTGMTIDNDTKALIQNSEISPNRCNPERACQVLAILSNTMHQSGAV